MTDDIPSRLRAWKSLRACDFEENSPLAEDLEAAAQAFQQQARDKQSMAQVITKLTIEGNTANARIRELEAEIIRLAEPPNPPLTMNDALALLNAQAREIERLKATAVPLCIGRPLIGILAKEGAWSSSDGRCVVAADDLLGADPYDQIDTLRETLAGMTGAAQG